MTIHDAALSIVVKLPAMEKVMAVLRDDQAAKQALETPTAIQQADGDTGEAGTPQPEG